ncbi:MAG TPA: sn-glycerol-3-phosphate ABC transporter ATP-binding protein UgpC [Gammaproteobacteria bacterium]|nr:sn-glycerol-3-phosphate ABC transporter ATP-binding protein UgpC [Gammaproteobacteria bacterium]
MSDVELKQVRKSFGDVETIHGVDLKIEDGEFTVFVGPSGCGKSTLLRLIAGLEEITSGEMLIDGKRVNHLPPADRGIAMVFQSYALYPHMTIFENMAFGLRLAKRSEEEIKQRVMKAAEILQVQPLLERKPKELSGGQRQRIAIGRAIVREPHVFLFDEPLSNLDAALRIQMRMEIGKLHSDLAATMVYVTHDQVEAMTMADKIVVLSEGNVEQVGAPLELYHYPQNLFVAGFIGSPRMNFIQGTLESATPQRAAVRLGDGSVLNVAADATGGESGDAVTVGIRPEHFSTARDDDAVKLDGEVIVVEQLGESTLVNAKVAAGGEGSLVVRLSGNRFFSPGARLAFSVPPHSCHLFNADGIAYARTVDEAGLRPERLSAAE